MFYDFIYLAKRVWVRPKVWSALKFSKRLYLLNPLMNQVDTLPDVRYWSEVLCCTIMIHISDLEVKVTNFEILS